jgi:hypothetical protein
MKILSVAILFLATVATAHAFTQTKTRVQVYQELIQAQRDGRDYVTDTSYPDVNPIFTQQLEQQQEARLAQKQTNNVNVASSSTTGSATDSAGATN